MTRTAAGWSARALWAGCVLLALSAPPVDAQLYQRRDLLGEPYQASSFAPCQEWGCRELGRTGQSHSGQSVTLQLIGQDIKLRLSLSPSGRVMGIEALAPAAVSRNAYWSRLTRQAFGQTFSPQRFAQCFASLRGSVAQAQLHGGGGEHYGVQCFRRSGYAGIRLYFDW